MIKIVTEVFGLFGREASAPGVHMQVTTVDELQAAVRQAAEKGYDTVYVYSNMLGQFNSSLKEESR